MGHRTEVTTHQEEWDSARARLAARPGRGAGHAGCRSSTGEDTAVAPAGSRRVVGRRAQRTDLHLGQYRPPQGRHAHRASGQTVLGRLRTRSRDSALHRAELPAPKSHDGQGDAVRHARQEGASPASRRPAICRRSSRTYPWSGPPSSSWFPASPTCSSSTTAPSCPAGPGRVAVHASAPPSAATTAFVEDCLRVRLLDGYGSTEGGIVALDGRVLRPPVTDHKAGRRTRAGILRHRLAVLQGRTADQVGPARSRLLPAPGRHHRVFDEDGFYRTGDIMARFGPD